MALILADTDVLIDYLADAEPIASKMALFSDSGRLKTSAITCFELLSGATDGKRGNAVRKLVDTLEIVPLDRKAAQTAALVRRRLEAGGQTIGMADSLIAGIALANDLILFTRNLKHFRRVEDLRLVEFE